MERLQSSQIAGDLADEVRVARKSVRQRDQGDGWSVVSRSLAGDLQGRRGTLPRVGQGGRAPGYRPWRIVHRSGARPRKKHRPIRPRYLDTAERAAGRGGLQGMWVTTKCPST